MEKERQSKTGNSTDMNHSPGADPARDQFKARVKWYQKKKVFIPALVFIFVAIAVVVYWYFVLRGYVSTDDAFIDGDRVVISSRMLGRITALTVDEGDTVKAGQLLVQLDDTDLQAQAMQAKAEIEYARKNVTVARVGLDLAQDNYNRAVVQFKENVIPQEEFDHLSKALKMAQAQYGLSQARVGTAQAQLEVVQSQLQNTQIMAPVTGVVAKRWALAGDVVQPSQPIFTIFDLQNVWVTANLEETKIAAIRLGDPVEISVDSYGGRHFQGEVIVLGAAAASEFSLIPPNNASGNFTKVTQRIPIKISFANFGKDHLESEYLLLPGMSVTVKINTRGNEAR